MIRINHPRFMFAGDEVICPAIELEPITKKLRITFHWGDDNIKIVGANMLQPNIFEFHPDDKPRQWFMKYAVSQNAKSSERTPYITVESIKSNRWQVFFARTVAVILVAVPLIAYIVKTLSPAKVNDLFQVDISFGSLAFGVPVGLIIFIVLWSSKVTELIQRLSAVKESEQIRFDGKSFSLEPLSILPNREIIHKKGLEIKKFLNSTEFVNEGIHRYENALDDALRGRRDNFNNLASQSVHFAENNKPNDIHGNRFLYKLRRIFRDLFSKRKST